MKIAMYGLGVVGSAYASYIEEDYEIVRVDPDKGYHFSDEALFVDAVMICIGAPTMPDGLVYTSGISQIIALYPNTPIMIKSTISPSYAKTLPDNVTYSPEFLRASSAEEDVRYQRDLVLGGGNTKFWKDVFNWMKCYETDAYTASFMKYTINTFLATKVSFMNEIADLYDGDWGDLKPLLSLDERLGNSHMDVPGPDGKRGWGGMCFPKDVDAFLKYSDNSLLVLRASNVANNRIRNENSTTE